MRPLALIPLLAMGCPGGEPVPILPEDSEPPSDTADSAPDTGPPEEVEVDFAPAWDPSDFYTILDVGPDGDFASPCEIEWSEVDSGTLVRIQARAEPYRCKIAVTTQAYENHPLVILGMPDEQGNLPVISGEDAVTSPDTELVQQQRWVLQLGGDDASQPASWVWVQDLVLTGARSDHAYTDNNGSPGSFADNAAAVRVAHGSDLHLVGLELSDSNNGLVIEPGAQRVQLAGAWLHGNGNPALGSTGNAQSEARGVTYEFCRFDALIDGATGSDLLDRSAGLVLRYSWLDSAAMPLSLLASTQPAITADPGYQRAMIYGNVIVVPQDAVENRIVQYGGDGASELRPGTLHLYHNTVISQRSDRSFLVVLPSAKQRAEIHNNVIHAPVEGHKLTVLSGEGSVLLADNWLQEGYRHTSAGESELVDDQRSVTGVEPGFVDLDQLDLHLELDSPCQGLAGEGAGDAAEHPVQYQYLMHQRAALREQVEDLGAFEG